jgi:hypothetical protein
MKNSFLLIILFLSVSVNAQQIEFPSKMEGYYSKPESLPLGKVHSILTTSYRNGNLLGDIIVETYDSNQRLSEQIVHNAGIEVDTQKMIRLSSKTYFEYEKENKFPCLEKSFETDNINEYNVIYKYENHRIKEELVYFRKNVLIKKTNYEYDDKKKKVDINSLRYFEGRKIPNRVILEYNDKKQWTKRVIYDAKEKLDGEIRFEYNEKGLLKKMLFIGKYEYFHIYEYKFDGYGNWIERIEVYSQKDKTGKWETSESLRTYRVITYFDEVDLSATKK